MTLAVDAVALAYGVNVTTILVHNFVGPIPRHNLADSIVVIPLGAMMQTVSAAHVAGKSPVEDPALGLVVVRPLEAAGLLNGTNAASPAIPSPANVGSEID